MYFSTTLILILIVVNILVCYLNKLKHKDNGEHQTSSSLDKQPMHEKDHGNRKDSSSSSSSSSSSFKQRSMTSSSSSQSWNHEVFLSFRGEDTRKTFVDHLYESLKQHGIQTYKDDETLARGETIRPALSKAIQESQIAVIVFSKNYADSSWCLDELAHIMECKDIIKQIVMPIFYDVDPSEVRNQNGKYGEAFDKYECEKNKHKVGSWREALKKAGNLSGWVPKDFANGHEAKCIKDIVAKISSRLSPRITNVNKDLIGIETRLQDLKSRLKIGSGGVRMVGILGVGGGGKTTLASAAYTEISHQFEACCLLANIRDESNKHGLTKLQEKLLSFILNTKVEISSEIEGKSMIKRRLCHKSVLVVLDDVDALKQLEALAGSHDWFGDGSRILITTRDEHLLNVKEATIYEVSLLSNDEAAKLFSRHAFHKDEPAEEYKTLSQEVVSYAKRLPLALEVLGSFLYDKDKEEWKCTLARLNSIPDAEVMERLKISFDGLQLYEKELFLDIACFLRRYPVDEAMMVLDASNLYSRVGIKVLVQKCLIKILDEEIEMHDLIEEMAHYIVRGEHPNYPEKHSRIWKVEDIVNLCDVGAIAPSMETEVLALRDGSSLRFTFKRLPNVIASMRKLRWIDWDDYSESSFPSNFQPTRLCCLMLRFSKLKQLWRGCNSLPSLKVLVLENSWELRTTPDFKGLPCLERLNLKGCKILKEIHPSLGYHEKLVWVNLKECEELESFPPIIHMQKLETLVLSECFRLKEFPKIQTNMDSLVNLHLDGTGIELVPPSVGQFCTSLVSFDLRKCHKLKRIEGNFRLLKRLKYLNIVACIQLEKLTGDFFGDGCCLKEHLEIFPRNIKKLDLSRCNLGDGDMPSDISCLLNLQVLDLSNNKFSRLHSKLSQIPSLKFLDLSQCENLVELQDLPSSIEILKAEECESLQYVGDLSNCKWLCKVSLERNNKLICGEKLVRSMLEINAVEDRFMSIVLPHPRVFDYSKNTITTTSLQLPHNWYNDFSGFLLCADDSSAAGSTFGCRIYMKQEMLSMDSEPADHWEEFDKNLECGVVGYVPFASLRQTSWWNPSSTRVTFQIKALSNPKIGLVPRKSKSRERPVDYSECWVEDVGLDKTFKIRDYPKSSEIEIRWSTGVYLYN